MEVRKFCTGMLPVLLTNFHPEPFPRQSPPGTSNSVSLEFVKHSGIHTLFSLTFNKFSPTSYEDALKRSNCLRLKTSSLYLLTCVFFFSYFTVSQALKEGSYGLTSNECSSPRNCSSIITAIFFLQYKNHNHI